MGVLTCTMRKGRVLTAVALTLVIGVLLIHASPVSALSTDITEPSPKTLGKMITFSVKVDIQDSESLPLQHVNLEIYNQDNPDPYKLTCADLPLVAESKAYFTVGGEVGVEALPDSSWWYGYGYRHAEWKGYQYSWGYGYGYRYQSGTGTTSITYNVAWNSPGTWPAGIYKINLIIIADGDSFVESRTVDLISVTATVDIDPDTLNIRSGGKWITAYIELPTGYNVEDVDGSTVMLNDSVPAHIGKEGWAKAEANEGNIMDHNGNGILERMVKFDRQAVAAILNPGDEVEITVTGEVAGTEFDAVDFIRVIDKGDISSNPSEDKAKGKDGAPGQNK